MLSLRDHTLQRQGVTLLDGISLEIAAGEKVALLGASGAGKSTLLRALRKLAGTQIAWCPQQGDLVPQLSVFHNLYMGALARNSTLFNLRTLISPRADTRAELLQLSRELGLEQQLWQSVDRLSGGQAQRTALGRALYSQQPVLLADEPVSAVDASQGEVLLSMSLQRHHTVVMALHDTQQALRHFDRLIGLRGGRIELDMRSEDISSAQLDGLYR